MVASVSTRWSDEVQVSRELRRERENLKLEELGRACTFKLCLERFIGFRPKEIGEEKGQDREDLLCRRKYGEKTFMEKV